MHNVDTLNGWIAATTYIFVILSSVRYKHKIVKKHRVFDSTQYVHKTRVDKVV